MSLLELRTLALCARWAIFGLKVQNKSPIQRVDGDFLHNPSTR